MQSSYDGSVDQSTAQLVIDQIEELVVTIIEEIRERPAVAVAILAALIGAFIGTRLAARRRGEAKPLPKQVVRKASGFGGFTDLFGLAFRLLENPIVRSYVLAMVAQQIRKRIAF
jgi:hypothetical protein